MFLLCKSSNSRTNPSVFCRTSDQQLCVWYSENVAEKYAAERPYDKWHVRPATSEDFAVIAKMKTNRCNQYRPPYMIMDRDKEQVSMSKKIVSSGTLVDIFENYESRKFAIASRAEHEEEFIVEVSQAMSGNASPDWGVRLREMLPLIVDMCCKYRGYKADTVVERRELVAGDLEMPRNA